MFEPLAFAAKPRYLKFNADGSAAPADATDHAVVRDLATNLEWRVQYAGDGEVDFADAEAAIATIGDGWRLPTRFELESIIALDRYAPAIDTSLFPGAESDWHWTSSPDAEDPDDYAWVVDFHHGYVDLYLRDHDAFVRAVRSVPASQ